MSDPRKNFMCSAFKHILNDTERPWGKESICPYCEEEKFIKDMEKKYGNHKEVQDAQT